MKTENIENIYQLSPLQQGILFHCLYSPESAVYFVQLCYILRGNINVTAFEKSWQQVVDSHTALRTAFYWENLEKPHQIVYRKIQVFLEQHDWRSISLSEQRQQLDNFLESERKKGFNFSLAPLMRLNLIRVADDSYYFVWSKHHLILDGWSTALVLKEIAKVYEAFCQGQNVPLATTSYGNYISWLQQQDLSKSEDFWRQLLKGIKAPTSLTSLQVHRLSDQEEKHNQQTIKLSKVTTDALRYVARQYGLTLNTLMQGAWAILLSRYSGEEDVLYGVTVSGRPPELPKVESTVGMFINTLPLRVKLAGEDFLLPWLVQLQAQLVEMRQYEYSPLVEIQEWSEIPRGLPLFESILVFENYPVDDALKVWQSNLEVEDVISFEETNYPLTVIVLPENELNIKIYYSSRFDTATINRMLGHLQALLSGIVANLQQRLSDLPLLKESEQHQLLREWNDTKVDYPLLCIHELFEVQVEKTPDAVAVVFEDQHLTYHELNGKANQLAHHLRSLGVKPEVLVGICVERSLDMVIGLLAILKAGGAYVPLDPNYPLERLQFILEQTQAPALLTQASLLETIPQHKAKVICLDTDWHTITQESQDNLCSLATSNNLAYIIYTSGSTGKPKGVQVPHSGLTNFLYSMRQTPGLTEKDTLVAVTTYSFDIAALELFLPIIVGARLVVASREIVSDGNQLLAKLIDSKATVMQATPVTWQLLLAAGWSSNYPLKVLCGGEALSASLAHEILGTGSQLWNLYGPTETTIWSTIYNIAAGKTATSTENLPASIGSPISNTQIYILDKHLQLVPIGVPGELHIGGDGLARGYLNLPELTSEKFIQNPFSNSKSQRLYKTGDLARYLPDGNIEFIGRIDNQIKIRGFRIELGEIEALLNTHPRIQEAVVIVQEDIPDNKRLVAYVICDQKNQSEAANPLQSLQIEQWQQVWQQTYAQTNSELVEIEQPNYNTVGWKSSYTGKRIPTQQMCKWVDSTVERILKLQPEHVLEIGCGTGMLLFQIAPHCLSYYGTDFSTPALDYVKEQIKCLGDSFSNVSLSQKLAHDFTNIEQGRFDTIILNSVVQYFPNINYLVEVLQGAVNSLAKGGFIFVGDVRSLPLLETFHTAINFYRASDSLTIDEFRNLVKNAVNQEQELVIDPAFFLALKQHLPQIKHVEVQLKPGDYHNELTLFRYDVIIHVAQKAYSTVTPRWLDYDEDGLNLSAIKQLLVDKKPEIIGVKHIPNARLLEEVTLVKEVSNFIGEGTIGQLRDVLQLHQFVGVEPENLWSLHDELPYSVHITWSGTGGNSCYDAIFVRNESRFGQHKIIPELGVTSSVKPWSTYANNPLKQESNRDLVSQLPSFLRSKLPDYMVPAAFVTLEALPLTPNGKVDRKALPAPELTQVSLFNIVPASTPIENLLAGIWAKILGIEKVGICSNFFELGGHSLIGTRVISQIRQVFGVELALRSLFEKPTIAGLAKEIEKAIKVDSGIEPNNIERIERSPELPLSFPQQRLWFLAQLEPDSPFYNIPAAVRLQGELDLEALQESFNEIVRRHEALRTNFLSIEGQGVAVISEEKPLTLSILDISSLSAWQQEAEVKQQATQEAQQPFDISSDHLLRVKLLRLGEQEHIILLSMHHIVSDAWSVGVLVQEFATFYSQFCNEEPLTEAELPVQYVDFAAWQRQWLQGEVLETQISYWLKQLDNAPKVLELPTDHSRPVIQTYRGANYSFELSKELSTSLAKLSQQQGSTLFMTLLAGFQTLLWRYTAQEDIIVGSPIANRNRVEIEGLIGFFVNTLVLRTNLAGNPSFEDLLLRVREVALGAYAHQDLPFELLVEKLKVERSLSHSPLFQVMFVLQNAPMSALELPGLTLTPVESDSDTSKFDLSLYMTETQEGLVGNLEYNTDLFEESSIQRMVSHLQTLLSGVVANPQQRLSELPLLRESEQHQLLREWNDTLVEYSLLCIHELFEAQVEKTPLSVAVVFEDQQLTYRELNQWANQLAHYLQSLEVGSGVLVGICFEPSLEQVVSLLAVLKANGVYVPLDPNYPQERLSFMLENSNVHTLLTKESLAEKISSQNAHIVCLDRDRDAIGKQSVENLNLQATPDDLAYAIYTSGSTGKPKAVLGKIRGIINRLHWMWKTLPFAASEVCIQKTSMNFVDHVAEIFSPLLKGIPLVVVPDNIRSDVLRLMSLLSDKKITRIVVVPSLLKAMLDTTPEELTKLQYLKYVFCSGEALPLKLASSFHEKLSSARLFNLYGSSEVAADVTCYEVNFWETGQRILQYFKPQVVREQTENQVIGVDQKSFTKPGVSAEMLARQFQRSELPSYPLTVDDYNDKLSQEVLPYTIDTGSPTYIGHMTSALPDFMHDMSKMISQLNQNLVKIETSKSLIFLEREAIAMLHRLVYGFRGEFYDENIQQKNRNLGIITTGGTTANISALLCARNSGLLSSENSRELSKESLYKVLSKKGYDDIVIIGSRLMHYSLNKASSMLGLGTDNIIFIDSNDDGKLDINLLKEKIVECRKSKLYILALVGIAGTTETGEIDPLVEMGDIAQEFSIHFHVDGAWGGATIFSDKHKGKLKGINKADSITICGHKQLYLPQGISVCLFKDPQMLNLTATTARYQAQRDTFDVGRFTIEGSRSAISLCLHGALHIIGKKGYEILINNSIEKAQYFSRIIDQLEPFELIMEPSLNIVNYRYIPEDLRAKAAQKSLSDHDIQRINQLNTQIQFEQFEQGLTFVSKTTLLDSSYDEDKQIVVFRTVLSNPNTTARDLRTVLEDQLRIANQIEARSKGKGDKEAAAAEYFEAIHLQLADELQADMGEALEEYLKKNTIPIGKPISNTQIYILDKYGSLLPQGVTGELYVGGDGLAQGYLDLPELTQEKFIPNPFIKDNDKTKTAAEASLYRTGDLARWLPDGNIEFVGRIDHQVKIRGFRVELGEIEALISQHPQIQQNAVIATEDIPSNKRLIAYVVVKNESFSTSQLRNFLQQKLPDYMIPAAFIPMKALPLTPNGKIDRKALPKTDNLRRELETTYIKPQNDLQKSIATIWQKVLKVEKVGIHDNFFELGGHSLLLVQVHSQLLKIYQKDFTIIELFRYPTISSLAKFIGRANNDDLKDLEPTEARTQQLNDGKARMKQFLKMSKGVK